jgi:hypothetical protein
MQKEKEFINLEIKKNKLNDIIKIENSDDLDNDLEENPCGETDVPETIKPNIKKIINKSICYKCKVKNSNYLNRNEYICRYDI